VNGPPKKAPWWARLRQRWSALPRALRIAVKLVVIAVLVPCTMVLCYLLLAWTLSSSVVNADQQEPAEGVVIYLCSNDVHVDLVVPRRTDLIDWTGWFPASHVKGRQTGSHVAFGWGNRRVYLEVPEWEDLTAKIALEAVLIPSPTVMHVSNIWRIEEVEDARRIVLTREQYGELVQHLQSGFALQKNGVPELIKQFSYGEYDGFYEGSGSYSAFVTCNEWSARGLRRAGVKVGRWTPFADQLMKHFPPEGARDTRIAQ
jgi:uncharacterized protein (TIGR02117 family)